MPAFIRLIDLNKKDHALEEATTNPNCEWFFKANQRDFKKIPGSPIAYWVSKKVISTFNNPKVDDLFVVRQGIATGDNATFLRFWYEVPNTELNLHCGSIVEAFTSGKKWFPHNKGGELRKWWGNQEWVISYDQYSRNRLKDMGNHCPSENLYFKPSISWSDVTSGDVGFRIYPKGFIFDATGHSGFPSDNVKPTIIAISNSKIVKVLSSILNPTMHFHVGYYKLLPILYLESINNIVKIKIAENITISKLEWDIRETSWEFHRPPLLTDYIAPPIETIIDENLTDWSWPSALKPGVSIDLEAQVESFKNHWTKLFIELHRNEEENNRIFIDLYGLQDELTPEVPYSEITILQDELVESARKEGRIEFDESVLARQFVSYGVGCLMGRYSVDKDGLILADAGATLNDFKAKVPNASFLPDEDAILPLTYEDDFSDDLPTRFKAWLRVISGKYFEDNLRWIEDRLGKDLRSYFIRDFYKDHLRRYKNRPIYWMIASPSGSFRTLMYLHRYTKDTVGKVLNDYLRPYRNKIEQKLRGLQGVMDSSSASQSDKVKAKKRAAQLEKISAELDLWEKDVVYPTALARIELDLDDGVKVNYRKLSAILEPVKQLEAKEEE